LYERYSESSFLSPAFGYQRKPALDFDRVSQKTIPVYGLISHVVKLEILGVGEIHYTAP
jgi:hypothetical protein